MKITKQEAAILCEHYARDISLKRTPQQAQRLAELARFVAESIIDPPYDQQKEYPNPTAPTREQEEEGQLAFVVGMLENLRPGEYRYQDCKKPFAITKRFLSKKERQHSGGFTPMNNLGSMLEESLRQRGIDPEEPGLDEALGRR